MLTGVLLLATGSSYWLIYLLVASVAALLPVGLVAGYRQMRDAGAWEQTRRDLEQGWPDMKKVRTIVLGDEEQWPPVPSLAHQIGELSTQVQQLNSLLSTGNGKKLGETVMSISFTVNNLQHDFREHVKDFQRHIEASNAIHRKLEEEIKKSNG